MTTCCINNCENRARSKGLCNKHYTRYYKHADTGTNFKAYEWWRKAEKRNGLLGMELERISFAEHQVLGQVFKETLSENGHDRSYEPGAIGYDLQLVETYDKDYQSPEGVRPHVLFKWDVAELFGLKFD